jgi:hypothetical protein
MNDLRPSPHRPGPKTEISEPVSRRSLMLDDRTMRILEVLGDGNVSRGARRAASTAYDLYQRQVK